MCKKRIQIKPSNKIKSKLIIRSIHRRCKKINQKILQQNNVTKNNDVCNDTTNVSSDNITMKALNQKENTNKQLGVTALIAVIESATESQSSRAHKQPLRSHPSNKIKVLLESGSDGDLFP